MLYGVDFSHWQGEINLGEVMNRVDFFYMKASEGAGVPAGGKTDKKYPEWSSYGRLEYYPWGAYHFARPQYSATLQADYFAELAKPTTLPPALDLEVSGGLGIKDLTVWTLQFYNRLVERLDRKPALYTNLYLASMLWPELAPFFYLWISNPGVGGTPNPRTTPILPEGVTDWTFYQYSWSGRVAGIPGKVDENRFNGDYMDLVNISTLKAQPAPAEDRFTSLEKRVKALEDWRNTL